MSDEKGRAHSLIIKKKKKLLLTGVSDVKSFDDDAVVMDTVMGELTVKGEKLHILGFNRETGDLTLEGAVWLLGYNDGKKDSSFFGRLFK